MESGLAPIFLGPGPVTPGLSWVAWPHSERGLAYSLSGPGPFLYPSGMITLPTSNTVFRLTYKQPGKKRRSRLYTSQAELQRFLDKLGPTEDIQLLECVDPKWRDVWAPAPAPVEEPEPAYQPVEDEDLTELAQRWSYSS